MGVSPNRNHDYLDEYPISMDYWDHVQSDSPGAPWPAMAYHGHGILQQVLLQDADSQIVPVAD